MAQVPFHPANMRVVMDAKVAGRQLKIDRSESGSSLGSLCLSEGRVPSDGLVLVYQKLIWTK